VVAPLSAAAAQLDRQTNRAAYRLILSVQKTLQFAYIDTSDRDFSTNKKENKTNSGADVAIKPRRYEMHAALLDRRKLTGLKGEQGEIHNRPCIGMNRQTRFNLRRPGMLIPNAGFDRQDRPKTDPGQASGANFRTAGTTVAMSDRFRRCNSDASSTEVS
jgi:hypothetical protein